MQVATATTAPRILPTPSYPQIILTLNLMSTTPPRFHWYIFVPHAEEAGKAVQTGHKLHAIDNAQNGAAKSWAFDATEVALATEMAVAAAAVIGEVRSESSLQELEDLLKTIPLAVPAVDAQREPAFTCRVWVREALRRMHKHGFIHCPDVDALESEMWEYGRAAAQAIEDDIFTTAVLHVARSTARTI